jgi:hypothetical protein
MSFSRLERGVPEAHGVSSKGLAAAISALEGFSSINSVMIMRHGVVLAEGWWHPYAPQYPHKLFSLSKSFTSTAIGMAIAEGLFTLDDPLSRYFRDKMPAELTPRLEAMTVRHLLTMSSGHACCPLAAIVHSEHRRDWQRGFFAMPLAHDPGSRFAYNSTATYMLAALIYRRAGMNVLDYLMPRLFAPLGIAQPTWDCCPAGINIGGWGLKLCTEDIAKFGQLYLQQGQWQGQQIVPAEWVAMATSKQISNDMNKEPDWKQGYGFQFWRLTPTVAMVPTGKTASSTQPASWSWPPPAASAISKASSMSSGRRSSPLAIRRHCVTPRPRNVPCTNTSTTSTCPRRNVRRYPNCLFATTPSPSPKMTPGSSKSTSLPMSTARTSSCIFRKRTAAASMAP